MRPAPSVHARAFDDELVILDLARGEYYALDAIGACLWHELAAGGTAEAAAKRIAGEYDVEPTRVLADFQRLIDELLELGLLVKDGNR